MHSKKYYIIYGLFFSLFVAAVLCLCLTIVQGMPHIDPVFFLMSFLVAFITSFVVTAVIPLARIAAACAQYYDAKPGSVAFRLIQNVFFSTLIMFFLGIVMTAFMTGIGEVQAVSTLTGEMMATNLFDRFVSLCLQFWPVIVIVAFLCDPAAGGLAAVITGERAKKAKDVASAAGAEAPSANAERMIVSERHDMTGFDAERARAQKIVIATDEEIADVVDAITGATWNTRNTIMEDLFMSDLSEHGDDMPVYKPPGQ